MLVEGFLGKTSCFHTRVGFDYDQRKIPLNLFTIGMESNDEHTNRWPYLVSGRNQESVFPLHHFTIGFQKPGICTDSWFLEDTDSWFLESNGKKVHGILSTQTPGFWNPMVKRWSGIFLSGSALWRMYSLVLVSGNL
jgi:hypothetical protein